MNSARGSVDFVHVEASGGQAEVVFFPCFCCRCRGGGHVAGTRVRQ